MKRILRLFMQASQSSARSEILLSSLHMVFKRFGSPPIIVKALLARAPLPPSPLTRLQIPPRGTK